MNPPYRGWKETKLPSGETRLDIDMIRRSNRLVLELGIVGLFGTIALLLFIFVPAIELRLLALAFALMLGAFGVRTLRSPSPKAWVLGPKTATVEWQNGKQETFTPTKVLIESIRERPGTSHRTYLTAYCVYLETEQGRIDVHGGAPSGDQHDLANTVAEALGVEVVQLWRDPID